MPSSFQLDFHGKRRETETLDHAEKDEIKMASLNNTFKIIK